MLCIKLSNWSTHLVTNSAKHGGGIQYFEVNANLYIISLYQNFGDYKGRLFFDNNSADFGGAIYVVDGTNSGICSSHSVASEIQTADSTECFFQALMLDINDITFPSLDIDACVFLS